MNPELTLILCLLEKSKFNSYFQYVSLKDIKDISKEIYYLYEALEDLHNNIATDVSLNDLSAFFFNKYPSCDRALYEGLFERLRTEGLSEGVPEALLVQLKQRREALKLSEEAFKLSKGEGNLETLLKLYEQLHQPTTNHLQLRRVSNKLGDLLHNTYKSQGLRWRLNCLNKSLGSLRAGDFGFIFARPETGKTTFLASEVSNFLQQTDRPVIWFCNEEQGDKVNLRVLQAFFGCDLTQLMGNEAFYEREFLNSVGDNWQLYDSANIGKRDVEDLVSSEEPALVVYDQLPKIKGFQNDREDLRLGSIFQWARELAKEGHASIGVSQADGTAEGVRYLNMGHVANAKTAVQAEADWVLGIGKVHEQTLERVRYLAISKNKLFGDPDSDPALKHGHFEVLINTQQARYEDIIDYA
jgi:KaiC/GvpD/RAD55 family RecA-like ATPase